MQTYPLVPVNYQSIRPGEVWLDTEGKPIQAHGFQVTFVKANIIGMVRIKLILCLVPIGCLAEYVVTHLLILQLER